MQNKRTFKRTGNNTVSITFENRRSPVNAKHNYEVFLPRYEAQDHIRNL